MRLVVLVLALTVSAWSSPLSISFPDGYQGSVEETRLVIGRAQGRIDRFAQEHGWEHLLRPVLYDSCEIYQSGPALIRRIRELHRLPESYELPAATIVGALEKRILLFVSPEEYERMVPALAGELNGYEKLFAHEIAHRLHVAVLEGDEDAMGPRWFYEGFAVVASGQHPDAAFQSAPEAMASGSYREYGALVRRLMTRIPLAELVSRAGSPNFQNWALEQLSP